MFRFFRFQIEIQRDQRPLVMIGRLQRALDDGSHPLEKIIAHVGLVSGRRHAMRHDRPRLPSTLIRVPQQILLDRQRCSRRQRAVDAIVPPPKVWIAVVRIHHRARPGMRRIGHRCAREHHGRQTEQRADRQRNAIGERNAFTEKFAKRKRIVFVISSNPNWPEHAKCYDVNASQGSVHVVAEGTVEG